MTVSEFMNMESSPMELYSWFTMDGYPIYFTGKNSYVSAEDPDTGIRYELTDIPDESAFWRYEIHSFGWTPTGLNICLDILAEDYIHDTKPTNPPDWVIDFVTALDNALNDVKKAYGLV